METTTNTEQESFASVIRVALIEDKLSQLNDMETALRLVNNDKQNPLFTIVGKYRNTTDVLNGLSKLDLPPDVIVLDLKIPAGRDLNNTSSSVDNGISLLRNLLEQQLRVLVYTDMNLNELSASLALVEGSGAHGLITKDGDDTYDKLTYGIQQVAVGNKYFDRDELDALQNRVRISEQIQLLRSLSPSKIEILTLLFEGKTHSEIAEKRNYKLRVDEVKLQIHTNVKTTMTDVYHVLRIAGDTKKKELLVKTYGEAWQIYCKLYKNN